MTLEEFYNENKNIISAIYKIGSTVNPAINSNYHDTDLLFVSSSPAVLLKKLQREAYYFDDYKDAACLIGDVVNSNLRLDAYACHYSELLYGTECRTTNDCILCDEESKSAYKNELAKWYYFILQNPKHKYAYHVLMGCYILYNNSYDLTDEQIAQVQLAHDQNISDEAMAFIKEFLEIDN